MSEAERIKRLNRLYAVASGINEAIVRASGETDLFIEACRIAVERGGLVMAWVGRNDAALGRLVPVARWGRDNGYVDAIHITTDPDYREGQGPGGTAFRTGQPAICNDIAGDHQFFAYREEALAQGLRSCAAFPLKMEGRPVAIFVVYASQPMYFDAPEMMLLTSLADNFSFALDAREKDAQRRHMEHALRASEARLRAVIENEPECVKSATPAGELIDINRAGLAMLDASYPDELVGRMIVDFIHPDDRQAFLALHRKVAGGGTGQLQMRATSLRGNLLWMDTHAVPLRAEDGSISSVLYVTRDVTAQRSSLQEILRLNAELEQRVRQRTLQLELANEELRAFSYSVAHDLRAPIASIGGFSSALKHELGPARSERARHFMERIQEGVARTSGMIDALLSLAQLSRTELRWEPVDLSAMAHAAIRACRQSGVDRHADVTIEPGLVARGDPRLLQLVLDNLLGNAWKFSAKAPRCTISFETMEGPEGETIYVVRDNGVGFETAYAQNLFGAFQRLHAQGDFPGWGIGLANVRRIVTRHGGRVWAQAKVGEGASFYFTLRDQAA